MFWGHRPLLEAWGLEKKLICPEGETGPVTGGCCDIFL